MGILVTPWSYPQGNSSISTSILHQPQRYNDLALWRVINFCKESLSVISLWLLHRTNLRWRFRKILWPSQNIWTLITLLKSPELCLKSLKSLFAQPTTYGHFKELNSFGSKHLKLQEYWYFVTKIVLIYGVKKLF